MSYSEKLDEAVKKFKAAKEASKKNLAYPEIGTWVHFSEEHAKFYAAACDVLKEKLKKEKEGRTAAIDQAIGNQRRAIEQEIRKEAEAELA